MSARQKKWAIEARQRLQHKLGDKCARCGRTEDLEFDCIAPQGDTHHKYDSSWRMSFYRAQDRLGNLQLLCEDCHNKKSTTERPAYRQLFKMNTVHPF